MSDTGEQPVTNGELKKALSVNDVKLVVVAVVVAIGTAFGAYRVVLNDARAQTDAGVADVIRRVEGVEQAQKQTRADMHEVQTDIRALYKAVMTGQKQDRLERAPVLDGGR